MNDELPTSIKALFGSIQSHVHASFLFSMTKDLYKEQNCSIEFFKNGIINITGSQIKQDFFDFLKNEKKIMGWTV
jgi:hypothetical protein